MIQFTSIICDGVFEQFPRLKIAFLEAGCGWLPYMMDRFDYEYETRGGRSFPNMKKKPSDYVKDCPVYVTCEPEETSLSYVTQIIGEDRIMFPSDYPHERVYGEFKDIPAIARADLSDEAKQKILYDNAKELSDLGPEAICSCSTAPNVTHTPPLADSSHASHLEPF